jgi:hypothetical protein
MNQRDRGSAQNCAKCAKRDALHSKTLLKVYALHGPLHPRAILAARDSGTTDGLVNHTRHMLPKVAKAVR